MKEELTLDVKPEADRPYTNYRNPNQFVSIPDSNASGINEHLFQGNYPYMEE
jgi:hypothetical protein